LLEGKELVEEHEKKEWWAQTWASAFERGGGASFTAAETELITSANPNPNPNPNPKYTHRGT
jgi:hypothetical protein